MICTKDDEKMIIEIQEDLIAPNIASFNEQMQENLSDLEDIFEVELDLKKVENIDSVGITFVVGLYKLVNKEAISFQVVGANSDIVQLFKLMKLDQYMDIEED